MKRLHRMLAILCVSTLFVGHTFSVEASERRPITMIVPGGPGSGTDALARLVANELSLVLGQPVVVENRAGASGVVGITAAAKAPADGSTIVLGSNMTMAINKLFYPSFKIDPVTSFEPLAMVAEAPFLLAVRADSPYQTLEELVAAARAKPGSVSYGHGTGTALLFGELFKAVTEVELLTVPYKSVSEALTGLLGGQVDFLCDGVPTSLPMVKDGRLRALAQIGASRSPLVPDVPTIAEAGIPDLHYSVWMGFFAPAGIPADAAARLSSALEKVMQLPETAEKIRRSGFEASYGDSAALARLQKEELLKGSKVLAAAGVKVK